MKRIWWQLVHGHVVPLEMRPEMHAAGCIQANGRVWNVPREGSGELRAKLEKTGVLLDEVDKPPKDERRAHPAMFHLPGTAELAEAEAREEARVRWRNSRTETGGPR